MNNAPLHWCLGMYGSGSTWLFNAIMQVAAAVGRPMPGSFLGYDDDVGAIVAPRVVKTHDLNAASAMMLADRADAVWLSIRDPRDCVTSLMLYQRFDFANVLAWVGRSARFGARFADHPRARLLRYEARFADDPATLDRVAGTLGMALDAADRARIFAALSRAGVEAHIAGLATRADAIRDAASGDIVDPATQWHRHHANRTGEVGRWRRLLTPPQVATIEQGMQDWMATFGYPAEVAAYRLTVGAFAITEP